MKTLVCAEKPPLYITKPSPWRPRPISPTLHPTPMKNIHHPTRTWKLHAEAKGFGGLSSTIPDKRIQRETVTRKNSGKNDDDDDQIPKVVFERMIVRILLSVGVPMAIGLALLHLFGIVKEQHLWDVPLWLPVLTTFFTFGTSALGIAYGTLSTSWDAEKKGSLLGVEEAQQNWVEMWREEEDESNK
ncbi:hypothetical protein L1049_021314 [Liquidambar formosana]|uniref:Uncharacterized protein n=1 Tax=Liquidambar formosana TaxID=63359 RepID=A0AAP0SAH1_LIQFO